MQLHFPDITSLKRNDSKIIVYTAALSSIKHYNCISNLYNYLNPDEKKIASLYYTAELSESYILSRSMLRQILAHYTMKDACKIEFTYNAYGKPYLQSNTNNIQFNLSHSNDVLCVAVTTNGQIGVDIEFENDSLNVEELYDLVFTAQELKSIWTLESKLSRQHLFYTLWTTKEAIVKAIGAGLSYPITQIDLVQDLVLAHSVLINQDQQVTQWYCTSLNLKDGYSAAIASEFDLDNIIRLELYDSGVWKVKQ